MSISTGTSQAQLNGTDKASFDDISGKIEMFGDHENCMVNADFKSSNPAHEVTLVGACGTGGGSFRGAMTIDGKPYNAPLNMQEEVTGTHLTGLRLWGTPSQSNEMFTAQIALNPPSD